MTIEEIKKEVDGFVIKHGYDKWVPLFEPDNDVPWYPKTQKMVDEAYREIYDNLKAGKYDKYPYGIISEAIYYWD